ncbi:PilX N-terminal domain-containing pilus assembly protein [Acidovorax sp. FHTAMBA]|uniref:pilus assembly PilX family protein n=1 Tax=Acidovorax sp. FHTAMBA TaxID=3140252 RepID=UPI0031835D20
MSLPSSSLQSPRLRHQRGVALFVVIVFVMLSMLLALWASRTSMFNEMVVGNDADYQRAFEAAQALIQDAELDIRGEKADGSDCRIPTVMDCRGGRSGIAQIPLQMEGKDGAAELWADLEGITSGPRCLNALCLKRTGRQDFWNNTNDKTDPLVDFTLTEMMMPNIGARYGEYSGATLSADAADPSGNPILRDRSANNRGGWYWIEVLPYDTNADKSALIAGGPNNLPLKMTPNVVYRITAVAHGRKLRSEGGVDVPVTQAVIQQTYARQKLMD